MESELKKRKINSPPRRVISPSPTAKEASSKANESCMAAGNPLSILQARNHAVTQAQHEGCTANFRIFDSPFGNFLIPIIPTRAELMLNLQLKTKHALQSTQADKGGKRKPFRWGVNRYVGWVRPIRIIVE